MIDYFHQLTLKVAIDIKTRLILSYMSIAFLTASVCLPDSPVEDGFGFLGLLLLAILTTCGSLHSEIYMKLSYRLYVIFQWISLAMIFVDSGLSQVSFSVAFFCFVYWMLFDHGDGGGGTKIKSAFSAFFGSPAVMNPV